jgi:oligoribonuclease (3'-5' exoribonuclease)
VSLADAEFAVNEYILKFVPTAGQAPLAGNTIGMDRAFLARTCRASTRTSTTATSTCRR